MKGLLFWLFNIAFISSLIAQNAWTAEDEVSLKKVGLKWSKSKFTEKFISNADLKVKSHSGFFDISYGYLDRFESETRKVTISDNFCDSPPFDLFGIYKVNANGLKFLSKNVLPLAEKGSVECALFLYSQNYWAQKDGVEFGVINYNGGKVLEILVKNISNEINVRDSYIAIWSVLILMDRYEDSIIFLGELLKSLSKEESAKLYNIILNSGAFEDGKLGIVDFSGNTADKSIIFLENFNIKICVDGAFLYNADKLVFKTKNYFETTLDLLDSWPRYNMLYNGSFDSRKHYLCEYPLLMQRFYLINKNNPKFFFDFCSDFIAANKTMKMSNQNIARIFQLALSFSDVESAKRIATSELKGNNSGAVDLLLAKYYYNKKFGDEANRNDVFNRKEFSISKSDCDSLNKYLRSALRGDLNGNAHFFAGVAISNCNCYKEDPTLSWKMFSEAYNLGNQEVKVIYDNFIVNPKSKIAQNVAKYFGQNPGGTWKGQIECERCKKMYYPKSNFADQVFNIDVMDARAIAPSLLNFEMAYRITLDDWTSGYWCSKDCSNKGADEKRKQLELSKIQHDNEIINCAFCSKKMARSKMISIYEASCYESNLVLYLNPFEEVKDIHKVCSRKCEVDYSRYLCKKNNQLPIPE